MAFLIWLFSTKGPNLNNMLTLITKSTCCTHQYTYHDSGTASLSPMIIISKNISTSSMAAYHDIFHQHQLICWWCSALTSAGVAHLWIFYLIILHCSWSWSNWVDLEIMWHMFYVCFCKNQADLKFAETAMTSGQEYFFSEDKANIYAVCEKVWRKVSFISKHLCILAKIPDVKIYVFSVSFFLSKL